MEAEQALEVEEPAIHDVESTRLGEKLVEDVNFVHFSMINMDKRRNVAAQIEQGVQLDGGFGSTERRSGKNRQTQIDGGVERVDRLLQIDTEPVLRIERSCHADQTLREVGVDTPVAHAMALAKVLRATVERNSEMVEFGLLCAQTGFDVAQALSIGQLREGHAQELIQTRERLHLKFALIARHTTAKCAQRQMPHQLRKYQVARFIMPPRVALAGWQNGLPRFESRPG